ncbi:alginate lyase family protein [Flavisphingomonas formosensis]|uniref:alginate lyase family protein n=1 Tax=Flavisphingomonas formosensis TaxID=861534 RepID=UPI0012F927F8|nr:alginate lyase family protein [Sphingomonas formosensis]
MRRWRNWALSVLLCAGLATIAWPMLRDYRAAAALMAVQSDRRGPPLVAPFDAPARRRAIAWRDVPFGGCPALILVDRDLPMLERFYTDDKQSVRDEAKWQRGRDKVRPMRVFGQLMGRLASDQLLDRTPDPARARCMVAHLEAWAKAEALTGNVSMMTSSNRAWFVIINAATALIVLKQDHSISKSEARPIERWLSALAWSVEKFDDEMYQKIRETPRYPNNHVYWAGAAAVTAGVAAQDVRLFLRGIEDGRHGLQQVDAQGFLSGELWRGGRAYRYTLWGAGPLALIIRYAEANGIRLTEVNDHAARRLAESIIMTPASPQAFERAAGTAQIDPWNHMPLRTGDTDFAELLAPLGLGPRIEAYAAPYRPVFSQMLGGNLTILYADPAKVRAAIEHPGTRLTDPPL